MLRRKHAAFVTIAALVQGMQPTAAQANRPADLEEPNESPLQGQGISPEEVTQQVADMYAEGFGVSADEAQERLAQQDDLIAALVQARELAGPKFAGMWIQHEPDFRGIIRLTSSPDDPAAFDQIVDNSPVPLEVRVESSWTFAELYSEVTRLGQVIHETLPDASTGISQKNGSIVVYLQEDMVQEYGGRANAEATVNAMSDAPIIIQYDKGETQAHHDYGGVPTTSCTTGFTVSLASAQLSGILTAGHCAWPQDYISYDELAYELGAVTRITNSTTDMGFWVSSHDSYPEFYASFETTPSRITVTGAKSWVNQPEGAIVCHRGATTGHSCGEITNKTFQPAANQPYCQFVSPNQPCSHTWVRVEFAGILRCFGGDSGGPWHGASSGNASLAFGIHSGGVSSGPSSGDCDFAFYNPIDFMSDLGVVLLTGA